MATKEECALLAAAAYPVDELQLEGPLPDGWHELNDPNEDLLVREPGPAAR